MKDDKHTKPSDMSQRLLMVGRVGTKKALSRKRPVLYMVAKAEFSTDVGRLKEIDA
jgi:hypothetical protein